MPNDNHLSSAPSTSSPGEVSALPEPPQEGNSTGVSAGLGASRKPAIIAAIVVLVILAAFVVVGVLLFNHPSVAAVLRDIFIILLGIQSMIIGLLMIVAVVALIYVALKLYDLIQFVENELRPMLERADDAVRTVQSRAVFVSDTVVKPVIEVMSYVSAVRSIIRTFTRPRN